MSIQFQRMPAKGPDLTHYDEYLRYIDAGEPQGTMSYEQWLSFRSNQNA